MDRPSRTRTRAIARARDGVSGAWRDLLPVCQNDTNALWRAAATGLLQPWSGLPDVSAALEQLTKDPAPLVRAQALRAMEPLIEQEHRGAIGAHRLLLEDPSRVVRVAAAWNLRRELDTNDVAGRDLLHYLGINVDQPTGALQKGVFHLDRGDSDRAVSYFKRAVDWDPRSPPLRQALAVGLSTRGQTGGAVEQLEVACELDPDNPEYRFKLGLALNETGDLGAAVEALQSAVKLDPDYVQAWYNLGLAYSALDRPEDALNSLGQAEVRQDNMAQIPYARATILARLGRVDEARAAAMRALEINPNHGDAMALLRMLGR